MRKTFESNSVVDTERIAADLAATLIPGDVVSLEGDLGAGKTQFARGLVRALGGNARVVSSPTYILLNVYSGGRLTVFHLDAYRVAGAEAFEDIGFGELLEQGGVVVVEWASRVAEIIPATSIRVSIEAVDETRRTITIAR